MRRRLALLLAMSVTAGLLPLIAPATANPQTSDNPLATARETEPVVLTGASFGDWAALADTTAKVPGVDGKRCLINSEGAGDNPITPDETCSHNTYEDPEVSSAEATNAAGIEGTPIDQLLGYRWDGTTWKQIPFQVDEMAQRYLSNNNSGFAFYSETDQHTTYIWDREAFRWTESDPSDPCLAAEPTPAVTPDSVKGLDTDDELVFMARDAGARADAAAGLPPGIEDSFEVAVTDPLTQTTEYVYVMKAGADGPQAAFDATNGYVRYERDANANVFLFSESSYENYGAAAPGPYYDPETGTCVTDAPKQRRPGDQATITTPRYKFRYEGRWLMTELHVNNQDAGAAIAPPSDTEYGPDLIDQWKARAFQQRPGGETPCCGYEEEVNNWGGSSMLMGERYGAVRTIRETWGADSGTNVVRREIFYRDEIRFGSYLRVHVIPPGDGIYAQWDYNAGIAQRYYNSVLTAQGREDGVAIDGKNDEAFGNSRLHVGSDGVRAEELTPGQDPVVVGNPGERCPSMGGDACINNDVDFPDPTFSGVNAGLNWEEVAGPFGSLVTRTAIKQITPGGAAQSLAAVPYYRDDACFDDGTGNDPGPHVDPREPDGDEPSDSTYTDPTTGEVKARECWDPSNPDHPAVPNGDPRFYQGSIGTHGVHILAIADSDNAGTTLPLTEIDGEQRVVVLPGDPGNVGETYGRHSEKPLVVVARPENRGPTSQPSESPTPTGSPSPSATPTVPPVEMPSCDINGPEGSRKVEGYIKVAQESPTEATTLHYQVLLPPCKDTDGDGTLDFKGPYPMVVDYSGYAPAITFYDGVHREFLREGYAVAGVNMRGTGCSGGKFDYFEPRQSVDGKEAIDFLGEQPYSTGRVAMVGKSYPGITQLFVAAEQPEHLAAIVPGHVFGDLYRDVPYPGGIQNTTFAGGWSAGRIVEQFTIGPPKALSQSDEECARNQVDHAPNPVFNPFVRALSNHYDNKTFMERSPYYFADQITAPTMLVQTWQDEQVGSRAVHLTERFSDDLEWRLLASNGDHGEYYGSHMMPEIKRFLRYHLAQEVPANDVARYGAEFPGALAQYNDESPVQINWETGAGGNRVPAWTKNYSQWPPPMVDQDQPWRLYLTDEGQLSETKQEGAGEVAYQYRPLQGTQQRGGYKLQGSLPDSTKASWSETPAPGTYAMFQTRQLSKDALLAGTASLDMMVASTAVDTDFQVTLTEIRPDGQEVFVQQGWLRASHRRLIENTRSELSADAPVEDPTGIDDDGRGTQEWSTPLRPFQSHLAKDSDPLVPGEPTPVRIEIFPFAHAFREGSAIRIYVEAPHTKPDLWGFALLPTPAQNTIFTGDGYDSSIALPLLEGEVAEAPLPPCTPNPTGQVRNQPCRSAVLPLPRGADDDNDGIENDADNCALVANPGQEDADGDGKGDACETDEDGDGVTDDSDNCPSVANEDQADRDEDGQGDACEGDGDGDGVSDDMDNCVGTYNPEQVDLDGDGVGDGCDEDDDNDGVGDDADNCARQPNSDQADRNGNGIGDVCEGDQDSDTVLDDIDNCPANSNTEQTDSDGDGEGDACDSDDDGDSVPDGDDNCPDVSNQGQGDADGDGRGDACDPPENTTLTFTTGSDTVGQHSDEATFEVVLRDEQGDPISNADVEFAFTDAEGNRSKTATTDADGLARTSFTLTGPQGSAQVRASYSGRDKVFNSTTQSAEFSVTREVSALTLGVTGKGSKATLVMTLIDDDDSAIRGQRINVTADGVTICTNMAATDANGTATCDVPAKYQGGRHRFTAVFPQNDYFTRSEASKAT